MPDSESTSGAPEGTDEVVAWKEGFRALAPELNRPLLEVAGVPEAIWRSPDAMRQAARSFLVAAKALLDRSANESEYRQSVERLLRLTFEQLAGAYGQAMTGELRDWLGRNFVNHEERMRWWMWSVILPRLASAYGHGPRESSPLPPSETERFNRIVSSYFSPEITRAEDERASGVRAQGMSSLERDSLGLEPDDPDVVDAAVIRPLEEATGNERARAAWNEIDQSFTPRERALVVAWARNEGASRKMPIHLIATRSPES